MDFEDSKGQILHAKKHQPWIMHKLPGNLQHDQLYHVSKGDVEKSSKSYPNLVRYVLSRPRQYACQWDDRCRVDEEDDILIADTHGMRRNS